jgi:uncharacterized membrane protein YeaQ/YmgE (transglycosylase-associated protein family)
MLSAILSIIFTGFIVGGLARWAVPGPDPMPVWLTIAIGLVGSVIGGGTAAAIFGRTDIFAILLGCIGAATLLVIAYRRFVQKRPITGPEARRLPTRGFGVERIRQRLRQVGVDPDSIGAPGGPAPVARDETAENLRKLDDLHDAGVLSDEEYQAKRAQLLGSG